MYISNNNGVYEPVVKSGVKLKRVRGNAPSILNFTVVKDDNISFHEGDTVIFKVNGVGVFYGYVFSKSRNKKHHIEVTAYDQMRYFKNKETYMYENKRADQLLMMICEDMKLNIGEISNSKYVIPSRIDDNKSLFDIVGYAIEETWKNTGARFIVYDDFGKITLKSVNDLKLDVLINDKSAEDFKYETSIDKNFYSQAEIYKDNSETGQREKYIAKDSEKITRYGVLQYTEKCEKDEDPKQKAQSILKENSNITRTLSIDKAFGDIRVRGGSIVMVSLNLGDIIQNAFMMVDEVNHTFENGEHYMSLKLIRSGEFK